VKQRPSLERTPRKGWGSEGADRVAVNAGLTKNSAEMCVQGGPIDYRTAKADMFVWPHQVLAVRPICSPERAVEDLERA
jgi:hypothetical protein